MPQVPPAVTAILLCHDSEAFVAEAVRSALAQDHAGPMELLISDDASSDRTFDVVRSVLADYRGPHAFRLLRREANAGNKSAHLNHVFPEASGDILVSFDDDDISESDRVRRIVAAFDANPEVHAVYSSFALIDEHGRSRGPGKVPHPPQGADTRAWFARVDAFAAGTTLAVRRDVVERFGPLDPEIHEDIVMPFRASLLGGVAFIPDPLVKARRHGSSLTADLDRFRSLERYRSRMEHGIERARRNLESRLGDIQTAAELMPSHADELDALRGIAAASFVDAEATAQLVSPSFRERVSALLRLIRAGAYRDDLAQHAFLALLPETYLRYKRYSLGVPARGSRRD